MEVKINIQLIFSLLLMFTSSCKILFPSNRNVADEKLLEIHYYDVLKILEKYGYLKRGQEIKGISNLPSSHEELKIMYDSLFKSFVVTLDDLKIKKNERTEDLLHNIIVAYAAFDYLDNKRRRKLITSVEKVNERNFHSKKIEKEVAKLQEYSKANKQ